MEEESEYELPSETCFTARRFEMVAVAGLLWLYLVACVFSVWWDFVFLFSFSSLRTHTAYCKYEVTLPHAPLYYYRGAYRVGATFNLSVGMWVCVCVTLDSSFSMRHGRESEATEDVFFHLGKKLLFIMR